MRRDAICCSKRCRQARHRFTTVVGTPVGSGSATPLRLAYADPPYIGMSARYYSEHDDFAGEVDHAELIRRLSTFDGWALSCSARSLPEVLALCPAGVRVAAWVRGERPTRSAAPLNAWEPVVYWGGRREVSPPTSAATRLAAPAERDASPLQPSRLTVVGNDGSENMPADIPAHPSRLAAAERDAPGGRDASDLAMECVAGIPATRRASIEGVAPVLGDASRGDRQPVAPGSSRRTDALVHFSRPRLTDPFRVVGAKPAAFIRWMFDLLGALPADSFTDLFPGSGGVDRAWAIYSAPLERIHA